MARYAGKGGVNYFLFENEQATSASLTGNRDERQERFSQ